MNLEKVDFGAEVSRILPLILREVTKKQMTVLSKGRLTLPQVVILDILRQTDSATMSDLAHALHLTMSAVTAIVDKMIKMGFTKRQRSTEDRRVVHVTLLKKGHETASLVNEERRITAEDIFSVLTEAEKTEYVRLLRKVYDGLKGRK
ncbi:MAG: MarR family transcriptional regulator [Candidatus Omnitrophota bacterium]